MGRQWKTESEGEGEGGIGSLVVAAEDTWARHRKEDLPYFEERLLVETCAQFVASSFQARSVGDASKSGTTCLQFVVHSHACAFVGAERLIFELVPRCGHLRRQISQVALPLVQGGLRACD